MRVLFIKQLWNPEPTARSLDFAKELIRQGCEVEVITSFPSYPFGKIYPGFKQKIWEIEKMEGVTLIRVPIYPYHGKSGIRRIINYLSYAFSATFIGLWFAQKADIIFAYQGALPIGLPAIILKKIRGTPIVYDINDIWPDTLEVTGFMKGKFLLSVINLWCNWTYKKVDKLTVLSEGFKATLIERGVPSEKIEVIYHWSRDLIEKKTLADDVLRYKLFPKGKRTFLYAGNMGKAQSLQIFLEVAKSLQEKGDYRAHFTFLGFGLEEDNLKKYAQDNLLQNVSFHSRVDSDKVSQFIQCADVLLVHLKDEALFRITIPSKILAYLKSGKPILMGIHGDAEKLIHESGAGLVCKPNDFDNISATINHYLNMTNNQLMAIGSKGEDFYHKNISIEISTEKYLDIFKKLSK